MTNILVIEKNLTFCKELINYICNHDNNLRICGITDNLEEAQELASNNFADIILMDTSLFQAGEIFKNDIIYPNCILIFSKERFIKSIKNQKISYNYCFNLMSFEKVYGKLKHLEKKLDIPTDLFEKTIKNFITNELVYLNYNLAAKGTRFLIEAIYILFAIDDSLDNLDKDIYPLVAKKFNTTPHNVKCNIRNATENMYYECDEKKLVEYLSFFELEKVVGAKTIIYTVERKISKRIVEKVS